jgi:hypothetical protein
MAALLKLWRRRCLLSLLREFEGLGLWPMLLPMSNGCKTLEMEAGYLGMGSENF